MAKLLERENKETSLILKDKTIEIDYSLINKNPVESLEHKRLLTEFMQSFVEWNNDSNNQHFILSKLKYIEPYTHDMDVGAAIYKNEIFVELVQLLDEKYETELRITTASVLGNSLQVILYFYVY